MQQLNTTSLQNLPQNIEKPTNLFATIKSGIVHFGTGNFHRAHQAVYCDSLLNKGHSDWGITGVSLRSSGVRDNLAPQNWLYTLVILGKSTHFRIVRAIQNLLVAPENLQLVIDQVAHQQTQLVTTTITEKGYCLTNSEIAADHQDIAKELISLETPITIYGYLAAALIQRCNTNGTPLTVLCCDNVHAGGKFLQQGTLMLLKRHSPETLNWVVENVAFSSSMVDRVTPVTDHKLQDKVASQLKVLDAAPVATEPFSQWIIENKFAAVRPPFDQVGAVFVDDIVPFERMKLRFLNAAHSMLASLGYLLDDQFIHQALERPILARFTEGALRHNVLPATLVPDGFNGEIYIEQVLERFQNASLPYKVLQVGTDSSQKIQQRWFPTIDDGLQQNIDTSYLALALAAWVCFIRKALLNGDLNDPLRDDFATQISTTNTSDVQGFLALLGAEQCRFFTDETFMASVMKFHGCLHEIGVEQTIDTYF